MFQYSMTPLAKIAFFYENVLTKPILFILYLALVIISLYLIISLMKGKNQQKIMLYLSVLMSYVLLASGFAATPTWPQYFFAPMPFIIISIFIGLSLVQKTSLRRLSIISITALLLLTFPFQKTINDIELLKTPMQWTPVKAHQFSQQIRSIVSHGSVVSLAPIYSLEAGLNTYPPFIVGPFVWRTAPLLSDEGRQKYGLISFHELDTMLKDNPPEAIITGFETDYGLDAYHYGALEKPFTDYAIANHYIKYKIWKPEVWITNITVWVKND